MNYQILFKEKNEAEFLRHWEELTRKTGVGPRYSPLGLNSWILISKFKERFFADKSFIYLVDGRPVAGVYLPIEKSGEVLSVSIDGDYVYGPIFSDRAYEKEVFAAIDELARENKISKIMFAVDPLDSSEVKYNYFQKHGYLGTSILNYVIDLKTSSDLLGSCRKGHRGDIKSILGNNDFEVFITDKDNVDYALHEEYRELHRKCSGRVTRPKETFDAQFERLKRGEAVLLGLRYKGKNIAYSYFDFRGVKANYASAVDDPEYTQFPLYHALIFKAMEYLKNKGVERIDTEQPSHPGMQMDYYPDQKQLNIALFKRGFPGYFVENFRGVKYFSQKVFDADMEIFKKNYKIS